MVKQADSSESENENDIHTATAYIDVEMFVFNIVTNQSGIKNILC